MPNKCFSLKELIEKLDKITTKEERERMKELGFVCHDTNFPCNKIKPPYRSYEKFKDNLNLKNKVQCHLYIDNCVNYSSKFGLRPCVVLYMGLEKEKENGRI